MRTVQTSALCRSRQELSNAYFLAKFGFDTVENEPFQVCPLSAYRSPRSRDCGRARPFGPAGSSAVSTRRGDQGHLARQHRSDAPPVPPPHPGFSSSKSHPPIFEEKAEYVFIVSFLMGRMGRSSAFLSFPRGGEERAALARGHRTRARGRRRRGDAPGRRGRSRAGQLPHS